MSPPLASRAAAIHEPGAAPSCPVRPATSTRLRRSARAAGTPDICLGSLLVSPIQPPFQEEQLTALHICIELAAGSQWNWDESFVLRQVCRGPRESEVCAQMSLRRRKGHREKSVRVVSYPGVHRARRPLRETIHLSMTHITSRFNVPQPVTPQEIFLLRTLQFASLSSVSVSYG